MQLKSIIFGFGLGLIFLSFVIFVVGNFEPILEDVESVRDLSDEEIMVRALELGMVFVEEDAENQEEEGLEEASE